MEQCDLTLLERKILERWREPCVVPREEVRKRLLATLVVVAMRRLAVP